MRFAGSAVDFTPQSLQSAGGSSNYSSAAGVVDVADSFAAMREKSQFDQLSAEAMKNRAAENISAMQAEADVMSAGVTAFGQTKGQALAGETTIKATKEKAKAQEKVAMMGPIGGIVSSGLKLFTGGMA